MFRNLPFSLPYNSEIYPSFILLMCSTDRTCLTRFHFLYQNNERYRVKHIECLRGHLITLAFFEFLHRSERLPVNSSTVLEALTMLPALIRPMEINSQQAEKFQEMLLGTGYSIPELMLQASCLPTSMLMWCIIMQRHTTQPTKKSAKQTLAH